MFERLDAVALHVNDWATSLGWYTSQLDLVPYHVEEEHRFAVLGFPGGGAALHLVGGADGRPDGHRCVPLIAVHDFDAAVARLRSAGVEILSLLDDAPDGYRLAQIADPEGNVIGIYTMQEAPPAGTPVRH